MKDLFTKKQIDELVEKYPRGSQEGKGLDAFVSYKIQYPDKRGNPIGFWYVTEASRIDDDVVFYGIVYPRGIMGHLAEPSAFKLSNLEHIVIYNRTLEVEIDKDFKPATIRELYERETCLRGYINNAVEKERRGRIFASRDNVNESIYTYLQGIDDTGGKAATEIANALTDEVCNNMIANRCEIMPALLHVLYRRLGFGSIRPSKRDQP